MLKIKIPQANLLDDEGRRSIPMAVSQEVQTDILAALTKKGDEAHTFAQPLASVHRSVGDYHIASKCEWDCECTSAIPAPASEPPIAARKKRGARCRRPKKIRRSDQSVHLSCVGMPLRSGQASSTLEGSKSRSPCDEHSPSPYREPGHSRPSPGPPAVSRYRMAPEQHHWKMAGSILDRRRQSLRSIGDRGKGACNLSSSPYRGVEASSSSCETQRPRTSVFGLRKKNVAYLHVLIAKQHNQSIITTTPSAVPGAPTQGRVKLLVSGQKASTLTSSVLE
jgi:hypothetical protein